MAFLGPSARLHKCKTVTYGWEQERAFTALMECDSSCGSLLTANAFLLILLRRFTPRRTGAYGLDLGQVASADSMRDTSQLIFPAGVFLTGESCRLCRTIRVQSGLQANMASVVSQMANGSVSARQKDIPRPRLNLCLSITAGLCGWQPTALTST
jgi:hypothetical protein